MDFYALEFGALTTERLHEILAVRAKVFVLEQGISYVDPDARDFSALHCFLTQNGKITAYLRAYKSGGCIKLGRVLTLLRGCGVGRELVSKGLEAAYGFFGRLPVIVESQTGAAGFYERLGFVRQSGEYMKEGVAHVRMTLGGDCTAD